MVSEGRFFVEVDCTQISEKSQSVSGDVYLVRRHNNRLVVVMSDGKGSGVMSKIRAEVVASMAINYTVSDESAAHAAEVIVRTFAEDSDTYGRPATFTILDIHRNGTVRIVEFGNMAYILLRGDKEIALDRKTTVIHVGGKEYEVYTSEISAAPEDRIMIPTEGVALSGRMTKRLPEGWGRDGVIRFCQELIRKDSTISARDICREVAVRAELNDLFTPKHDLTCGAVYFRQPRRILVCTGPPYNERKDEILADMVERYPGTKLICGGTTAQIISRELGRQISVDLRRDPAGLPPTSTMEGVDLITEGVLTLSRVKGVLEMLSGSDIKQKGTDGIVARMLLDHDIIEFVVGTRINPVHQNPDLPVELELRRNLIKNLGALLESKYMKEVKIQYI